MVERQKKTLHQYNIFADIITPTVNRKSWRLWTGFNSIQFPQLHYDSKLQLVNKWSKNSDERLHRMSCHYWVLWMIPFAAYTAADTLKMLFNMHDNPQNRPFLWRDLEPHLTHGSAGPPESTLQSASRSLQQPFFAGLTNMTNRQTTLLLL